MKTIAITGGIGSGKSAVSALLSKRGIPVYDADSRTKALYHGDLLDRIEAAFGRSFRLPDNRVDFAALAAVAFASEDALARLEAIVHPAVLADFNAWRDALPDAPLVAIESAIILDKPLFDGSYDAVVLVYAPVEECVTRVLARNPDLSEDAIRRRIAAQRTDFSRADYLLINDGTLEALAPQVEALVHHLLGK